MSVRVRFAPSPTGPVHVGNIRVAIYNWLFAKKHGGKFFIRIEDTDRARSQDIWTREILKSLDWLGLDYCDDEYSKPPIPGDWASTSPCYPGIFCQSDQGRYIFYEDVLDTLLEDGSAYYGEGDKKDCVLFRVKSLYGDQKEMAFDDLIYGHLTKPLDKNYDFVIRKSNGDFTFHFANVVDDLSMKITHVIRGNDHIENTFRHVVMAKVIIARWPYLYSEQPSLPRYAHLPMITNSEGKPFSKRDGDVFVGDFRDKGFLADALFNYLVNLGWSAGDDQEILSRKEIIDKFSLGRVKKAAAQWDPDKLKWMNGKYLRGLSADEFKDYVHAYIKDKKWIVANNLVPDELIALLQPRVKTNDDLLVLLGPFIYYELDYDKAAIAKRFTEETPKHLEIFIDKLKASSEELTPENTERALRDLAGELQVKLGVLIHPVRLSVTGQPNGIGLFDTLAFLGKEKVIEQIEKMIKGNWK